MLNLQIQIQFSYFSLKFYNIDTIKHFSSHPCLELYDVIPSIRCKFRIEGSQNIVTSIEVFFLKKSTVDCFILVIIPFLDTK